MGSTAPDFSFLRRVFFFFFHTVSPPLPYPLPPPPSVGLLFFIHLNHLLARMNAIVFAGPPTLLSFFFFFIIYDRLFMTRVYIYIYILETHIMQFNIYLHCVDPPATYVYGLQF